MTESESKEDLISNLPDCLIHQILSFLPSTKQAIQTGVLSKRWHKQWTRVPVLIIDSDDGTRCKNILKFYNCLKIRKVYLGYGKVCIGASRSYYERVRISEKDLDFDEIVCFATRRHVEDLTLSCFGEKLKVLTDSIFNNDSFLKLETHLCDFMPQGKVNWTCLKQLKLYDCKLSNQALELILFGSPLLESFELSWSDGFDKFVLSSESLKRLVLVGLQLRVLKISCPNLKELSLVFLVREDSSLFDKAVKNALSVCSFLEFLDLSGSCVFDQLVIASESLKRLSLVYVELHVLEISCPNLKELSFWELMIEDSSLFDKVMKNALSDCLFLEFLELSGCCNQLVIASESLKRLVIKDLRVIDSLQVSCTNLEKLELSGALNFNKAEFLNLPSSVIVDMDFECGRQSLTDEDYEKLIKDVMQLFHHVTELTLRKSFIEVLPGLEGRKLSTPMLYTKCLTLEKPVWTNYQSKVAFVLHTSPKLETLIITESDNEKDFNDDLELTDFQENYWNSTETVFNCLESHLKTVEIVGTPISEKKRKLLTNFLEFLLKNARVLETMDITSIWIQHFKERLLSSPRRSQLAIIELRERNW